MPTKQRFNTIKHDTSLFLKSIQMKCGKTCALLDDVEPESRKHPFTAKGLPHTAFDAPLVIGWDTG